MISPRVEFQGFDTEPALDDVYLGGIGLGYRTAGPMAFELTYLAGETEPNNSPWRVDTDVVRLDALAYLGASGMAQPFLVLGAGQQRYDYEALELKNDLANAGLGVHFAVNAMFGIRTDVRAIRDLENEWTSYSLGVSFTVLPAGAAPESEPTLDPVPVDVDEDGVPDRSDRCPGTPAATQVDVNGCELVADDDGDGVANNFDRCPDSSAGARVNEKGCYLTITETREETLNIVFATGSADVDPAYYGEVERIAQFMREYPTTRVVIEGHTDDRGSVSSNFQLSQRRAEAVAQLLVQQFGIDRSRVRATSYGPTQPIAPNDTPENRAQNRRVVAKVSAEVERIQR